MRRTQQTVPSKQESKDGEHSKLSQVNRNIKIVFRCYGVEAINLVL